MIETGQNYVDGSLAKKIEYDVYEENKVLKRKKKAKTYFKVKLKLVGCILLAFSMCFVLLLRYTQITELNYKLSRESKKYEEIKKENSQLKIAIEKNLDLTKIREIAETRLGMHKPDKYQIVHMKVQKDDFSKVTVKNEKNNNLFATISQQFDKIGQMLY